MKSPFTDDGEEWLEELVNAIRKQNFSKSAKIGHHKTWGSVDKKNGQVPKNHPEYGQLIKPGFDNQYLIISNHSDSMDPSKMRTAKYNRINEYETHSLENFGKVRVYEEAKSRGVDDLFTPITGWDSMNFRWITMPVVSDVSESDGGTRDAASIKRELRDRDEDWIVSDEEVGKYNGRKVFLDYGEFGYNGQWKVSKEQISE